jgi:PAS domain S-box-containing protein
MSGAIWMVYEYQAGKNDIKRIENEYLEEKKDDLRTTIETLISGVQYRREKSHQKTEKILQDKMEEVFAMAANQYSNYNTEESSDQIKRHIIDLFMSSKFANGSGYFWILDNNHTMIAHPYNRILVGKNQSQTVDKNGNKFAQEFVRTALQHKEGGFVSYSWTEPNVSSLLQQEKGREKIAFVKVFPPYNWIVGVGLYVHDIEKNIQQDIIGRLNRFKHGDTGYVFSHTFDGICLNHINKELIGKNRWKLTNQQGVKLVQELSRIGRQPDGGFLEYIATSNPKKNRSSRKVSYVKSIDEWQWVIGTGVYLDEIETKIADLRAIYKKRMLNRFLISLVLILLAFAVSYWGSTFLTRKLEHELQIFMTFFSQASKEQTKVDPQQLQIEEFTSLAVDANAMIESQQKTQLAVFRAKMIWERTFDAVPDTIIILDANYQIIQANRAMANLLDVPIESLIHQKCYRAFHGADEPPPNCPHMLLLQDHRSHHAEIFNEKLQRHFSITVSPIQDNDGTFLGSVHIARDISDQKNAELTRIATEEKLRKTEKMEAIGLMAGGVAHDLNNILSGVVSYPELLLLQLSKDDKLYKPIKSIQKSGKRAAAVVSDLLTVARGVATVKEVYSLNNLVRDYLDSPEFTKVNSLYPAITVQTDLQPDLQNIYCAPIHIQKVLMNLITNALEAIGRKGTVFVTTRKQPVAPDSATPLAAGSDYAVLTVRDTGSGISDAALKRIFEPFYSSKVMGRSGTGLGLAIVWNTIKDHNGTINVTSDEKGTTFTMHFPVSEEKPVSPKIAAKIEALKGGGSVLVVDDDRRQRDIASQMLTMLGYTAKSVASGEEAVTFCRNNSVDILLLDMIMEPGLNGAQTYQQIVEFHPFQKAVIASGFSRSDDVKAALNLGMADFVKKPYSMEQLGKIIKEVLSK